MQKIKSIPLVCLPKKAKAVFWKLTLSDFDFRNFAPVQSELNSKNFIHIDARNRSGSYALDKVYGEMTMRKEDQGSSKNSQDEDLLDLLDSVL